MTLKHLLIASALCATTASAFAANVGVSISVGEPGFYGRIDIGDYPQPVLVNTAPVVVQAVPVGVVRQPVYMHVPPAHARNWTRYCGRYGACGQPVYFVKDSWYQKQYVPAYRERHGRAPDRRDPRHDDHRPGPDRNPGRGHDHDHGPDHGPDRGPRH
ncbi:MAG: hypothetical protein QM639_06140 [Rhodocyclaceae bacterium]